MVLRHMDYPVWLDSGKPHSPYGRFDILTAAPSIHLCTHGSKTLIAYEDGMTQESAICPFQLLASLLPTQQSTIDNLPFCGGALGYFGYDLGRHLEKLPELAHQDIALPDMSVGIYPWAIIQDHEQKAAWLITNPAIAPEYDFVKITELVMNKEIKESNGFFCIKRFEKNIDSDEYINAIKRIQEYIVAGDCYQVNFAQRFSSTYEGDPFVAYLTLREVLPSPFSGYMQLPQGAILSLSPERFIQVRDNQVETKPIKGTIKRGNTPKEDKQNAQWLLNSHKNRAENVMIVDLLRNDLSKHCDNVKAPSLCELQSFANVHHLVSTVTATLKDFAHPIDVLRDSFPGGSITGAPKVRAMEIIEELEPTRRSLYCGSLGYMSADGQMDTSIAIRTLVCDENNIHCWGGGGIVADSEYDTEYQESIAKVKVLMDTLEKQFL